MNKKIMLLLTILLFPLLMMSGLASWVILGEKTTNVAKEPISVAVCHLTMDGVTTNYTRIEKALEVANKNASESNPLTVYVYTGLKKSDGVSSYEIKIINSCEINSFVTLCLPYDANGNYFGPFGSTNDFMAVPENARSAIWVYPGGRSISSSIEQPWNVLDGMVFMSDGSFTSVM